jgi:MFS transporter, DHA1 family, tetracycline resistance protein
MNSSPASAKPATERSIIPLILTVFIDLLGVGIAAPILSVVLISPHIGMMAPGTPLGVRTVTYGFLIAAFPLAQFFGAPILGALSDRYGRKPILMLSLVGTAACYGLFALGIMWNHLILLFTSRILQGFAGGNISIALSAIADVSKTAQAKTRNFGYVGVAFGLGLVLGPYFGGKLADPLVLPWFNFSTPFWFAGGLTLINTLLCLWLFRETRSLRSQTAITFLTGIRNLRRAFSMPNLRVMFLVIFLITLGFNFFFNFFQLFLIDRFGFDEGDIGDFIAYTGMWVAISQGLMLPRLSKAYSPGFIFQWCCLILAVTLPLLLVPRRSSLLYVIAPFIAISFGLSQPVSTTIVSELSTDDAQGEILGINQSVQSMGMAIPPILAGFVASVHVSLPILVASAFTLLGWAIFTFQFKKPKNMSVSA